MSETANAIATTGGGLVGSVAALAVKPPKTPREGAWRTVAGVAAALGFTGYACETLGIAPDAYYRVVAVAVGVGFGGWHVLTIVMVVLDGAVARAKKDQLGFVITLLKLIRGQEPSDK